jgi:hypothetical protein
MPSLAAFGQAVSEEKIFLTLEDHELLFGCEVVHNKWLMHTNFFIF